jgi:hypothetical protein
MADLATIAANQLIGDAEAPYVLITQAQRQVGTVMFDVTVREVHSDETTITVNPTETGTPMTDHAFDQPAVVEITAGSSDSTGGYPGYSIQVYEALLALKATKEPFDVYTGKRAYPNMLISNLLVTTDDTSEYALMVTCRLQQVIITSTSSASSSTSGMTQANQANPASTAPEVNVGTQTLIPVQEDRLTRAGAVN